MSKVLDSARWAFKQPKNRQIEFYFIFPIQGFTMKTPEKMTLGELEYAVLAVLREIYLFFKDDPELSGQEEWFATGLRSRMNEPDFWEETPFIDEDNPRKATMECSVDLEKHTAQISRDPKDGWSMFDMMNTAMVLLAGMARHLSDQPYVQQFKQEMIERINEEDFFTRIERMA